MSTLSVSSSPSPVASPHSAFHQSSYFSSSSSSRHRLSAGRLSPRCPASCSPKRAAHAQSPPPPARQPPPPATSLQSINERDVPPSRGVRYVDSSTQYSPECFPPTAGKVAGAEAKPAGSVGTGKKRKEVAPSDRSPDHMSAEHASSVSGQDASKYRNEPDPRQDPAPDAGASAAAQNASSNNSSSAASAEPPVQEARSTHGHSAAPKRSKPDPATLKVMPSKYENCNSKDLGALISNMLLELIRINDQIPLRDGRLTRFHSRAAPGISVYDYLQRLIQHATLSPPILLSMVYYIDRLCTMYTNFTINSLTVHRFLITAATVAAKGLSDSFWTNPTYARIGGIPVSELATLELELLQRVDWKIVPKPEVLEDYYSSLVERTEGYTLE